MNCALAAALYADAVRLYHEGDLHCARETAEGALLSFSTKSRCASADNVDAAEEGSTTGAQGDPPARARQRHRLFGNLLLLLSTIYMAAQDYAEAERLLSTCEGYWKEHLANPPMTAPFPTSWSRRAVDGECEERLRPSRGCNTDFLEAMAGVAYNKAILYLERLGGSFSSPFGLHDNEVVATPLADACGSGRVACAASTTLPTALSPSSTLEPQQARLCAMAALRNATDWLSHTLGPPRRLLADVLHTLGVCHYEEKDYCAALDVWQRSLAIRIRLRASDVHTAKDEKHRGLAVNGDASERGEDDTEQLRLALTIEHVAQVYRLLDRRSTKALKLLDTVAETRKRLLGPTHPLYARTLRLKAVVSAELGRTKLASALLDRCAAIYREADATTSTLYPPLWMEEVEQWQRRLVSTP